MPDEDVKIRHDHSSRIQAIANSRARRRKVGSHREVSLCCLSLSLLPRRRLSFRARRPAVRPGEKKNERWIGFPPSGFEGRQMDACPAPCPDPVLRRSAGVVAKVSTALFEDGFNILDAHHLDDTETGEFLYRRGVRQHRRADDLSTFRTRFAGVTAPFAMNWSMRAGDERKRVLILVSSVSSRFLVETYLTASRSGELAMDVVRVPRTIRATPTHSINFGENASPLPAGDPAEPAGAGGPIWGLRHTIRNATSSCSPATCRIFLRRARRQARAHASAFVGQPFLPSPRAPGPTTRPIIAASS